MIGVAIIFSCIVTVFYAGSLWPHPASMLYAGAVATIAGMTVARVQREVTEAKSTYNRIETVGRSFTMQQLRDLIEMQPGEDIADYLRMPVYVGSPEIKPLTGGFTCQMYGRRILVLEHDPAIAPIHETVEELF